MRRQYYQLTAILLLSGGMGSLHAQNAKPINVVTSSVPFLRISPDARAGGMGDIGVATSVDANAIFWNLGKVPFDTAKCELVANYTPWLRQLANDVYMVSIGGNYKIDENQSLCASLRYFNMGDIQFTDNNAMHLSSYRPREFGIEVGYARKLTRKLGLGVALKYIHSSLADGSAGSDYQAGNAVAADIGLYYNLEKPTGTGWAFGAAITNLGSKISYIQNSSEKDFIPANLGLGATYTRVYNNQNKITFGVDINKLLVPTPPEPGNAAALAAYRNKSVIGSWFSSFGDAPGGFSEELREVQVSLGAEYWYENRFAFRAGYFMEDKTKGDRSSFTIGASARYTVFTFNFSYLFPSGDGINRNPLSNTLRFGLVFDISNK